MQRTDKTEVHRSGRRKIQSSTTLNRRYVKRPDTNQDVKVHLGIMDVRTPNIDSVVMRSPKIQRFNNPVEIPIAQSQPDLPVEEVEAYTVEDLPVQVQSSPSSEDPAVYSTDYSAMEPQSDYSVEDRVAYSAYNASMEPQSDQPIEMAPVHPIHNMANVRMRSRKRTVKRAATPKVSAREMKDRAIKQALEATVEQQDIPEKQMKQKKSKSMELHFGLGRLVLALACAAVSVLAIVYFVNLSMPDVSLKVAAMQTGINATYPGYTPRDYSLSSITSENKKITLDFKNSTDDSSFTITEEASSWDSNALLSNYVKDKYGDNYTAVKEQGLTIYVSNSDAAWVNGGVMYKITAKNGSLTNKQIRAIATSL